MNIKKEVFGMVNSPIILNKIRQIRKHIYTTIGHLSATYSRTSEPVSYADRLNLQYTKIETGEKWGGFFDCAWFNLKGTIPIKYINENVQLILDFKGEGCIYDNNGAPIKGLSQVRCFVDFFNAKQGKKVFVLDNKTPDINLWVETGNNGNNGKSTGLAKFKKADIVICNQLLYDYYFDLLTLYFYIIAISKSTDKYKSLHKCIVNSLKQLGNYSNEEIIEAKKILQIELVKENVEEPFQFYATGHAHLDLAWLWPIRETKRKAARTFTNQLYLIENHDDYVFGASQPQQFQWMKDLYPALYERIKSAVSKGGLEPQGGMWVEADTNVTGSESLVRQMLYGKRFFKEEFNKDMKILWLPDVFGFSGALPQLIKKAGMDYFLTIKLSWNEQNKFPHHSFIWEGIDESSVVVHMPPEGTYNSEAIADSFLGAYENYKEKFTNCAFIPYGIGDGGGGPSEAHYELITREKNLPGLKKVKLSSAIDFFNVLNKSKDKLPKFKGELYLEKHQGTLTTQSRNKRYNRKIEIILKNVELLASFASTKGYQYPKDKIENIWKEVLLYQFHDIIPGSSIHRVYVESVQRYIEMIEELNNIMTDITAFLSNNKKGLSVINTLQYERYEYIKHNKEWLIANVKPFAASHIEPLKKDFIDLHYDDVSISNDLIEIIFNNDGSIAAYIDKLTKKNYAGAYLNKLTVYPDKKLHYNAWDIDINYTKGRKSYFKLISSDTFIDGPTVIRRNQYQYDKSTLTQDVILVIGRDYAEIKSTVNWNETHKMLRAEFMPSVYSDFVLCDIQWGNIKRSTRTDNPIAYAQYEICAHKYVDVSDDKCGFAILNDCKYGHRVKDGLISLNLLRSPVFPDETADKGEHTFTYAIYAHNGSAFDSRLIENSYLINNPLIVNNDNLIYDSLFTVSKNNIIIETIKIAEKSNEIVIRAYESTGHLTEVKVSTSLEHRKAYETNLLEDNRVEINLNSLSFKPYEIKTIILGR